MKIVTKKGDCGKAYIKGKLVNKSSKIAEAVGSLDETITFLEDAYNKTKIDYLLETIKTLRRVGSDLIGYTNISDELYTNQTSKMEEIIDSTDYEVNNFITFTDQRAIALDKARAMARRLERRVVNRYRWNINKPKSLFAYLNRLSDLLFAYAVDVEFSEHL